MIFQTPSYTVFRPLSAGVLGQLRRRRLFQRTSTQAEWGRTEPFPWKEKLLTLCLDTIHSGWPGLPAEAVSTPPRTALLPVEKPPLPEISWNTHFQEHWPCRYGGSYRSLRRWKDTEKDSIAFEDIRRQEKSTRFHFQ